MEKKNFLFFLEKDIKRWTDWEFPKKSFGFLGHQKCPHF